MNKLKRLGKLRQYREGDIADYLKTEHRQNLIAIEDALRLSDSDLKSQQVAPVGADVFFFGQSGPLANVLTNSTSGQIIDFEYSGSAKVVRYGELLGNVYYPKFTGKLFIDCVFSAFFNTVSRSANVDLSIDGGTGFSIGNYATDSGGSISGKREQRLLIPVNDATSLAFTVDSNITTSSLNGCTFSLILTRVE